VKGYIGSNGYVLVVGVMNLIEVHRQKKRWADVAGFAASVPFCIAQNPELITEQEVLAYPSDITLPIGFRSSDYPYSPATLKEAIEINLRDRVSSFDRWYRNEQRGILESILNNRGTFPPDDDGKYSQFQLWLFLQTNVLRTLYPKHEQFLHRELSRSREIDIRCFKSIYIQVLAIFLEYYVQKKDGKPSDIGDIYQLSYVPYVSLGVLDKERDNLVQRMNQTGLYVNKLSVCNLTEFRRMVETGHNQ
jgi:hypothetical protein